MKLKQQPEDFVVEEVTQFPVDGGPFAAYVLTKKSLGTSEALDKVRKQWNIPLHAVSYGGLKDRHALTTQWVTIRGGPPRDLELDGVRLEYRGQASRAFTSDDILANRFRIVLRDLSPEELHAAMAALDEVKQWGLPNYFDKQRFGSVGWSGDFVARAWCLGDYERALWLALADPHDSDRAADKKEKQFLREHWGDWAACKKVVRNRFRRAVVAQLADQPGQYRRAMAALRRDQRALYLAALQSYLWNAMASEWIRQRVPPQDCFEVVIARWTFTFYRRLNSQLLDEFREIRLPLPSARCGIKTGPVRELMERAAAELGLEVRQLRIKYPRDSFFSKGDRSLVFFPRELTCETGNDELNPGKQRLTLSFELPRGSYATILVKRITEDRSPEAGLGFEE
ncbi:tRNA pseudouridine(13) synthase TruD [Thermogutta sp.]|uniref:tRNA pseudouridine(13) synthase TruD n=1 Tax=Thermogutta sp. TaxID=1962930 RepID=UPI003C7BB424